MFDALNFSCEKRDLQEAVLDEFPSNTYSDSVLEVSYDPSVYDVAEDNLDALLKDKSWRDINPSFVEANHDEYVLMNERALPVFLGAWLWKAAQDPKLSNQIMSSLVFHLAAYGGSLERESGLWARGFKGLSQKQRDVIRLLLKCAVENAVSTQDRAQIEKAIASVEANHCPK